MSKTNPYTKLKLEAQGWIHAVLTRRCRSMWTYPANTINTDKWSLWDLAQRVQAAEQLGYDVRLRWAKEGLVVEYVEKLPATPYWY